MMGRILGNHSDVYTFGELHFFGQLCSPSDASKPLQEQIAIELAAQLFCIQREGYRTHGNPQRFSEEARAFLAALRKYPATPTALFSAFLCHEAVQNGKSIPCDQTPRNVFYIAELLRHYPQAKVVNMIRDPRDVLLSQKRKWHRRFLGGTDMPLKETFRDWINYHPITISRIWHTAISTADRFADNERVMSVYFEELLANPEATVQRVCDFVGIAYADTLLQVPQVGSSSGADKPRQLGINSSRAHSWEKGELSSAEIYLCEMLNAPLMEKHNYRLVSCRPNPVILAIDVLSFPVKLTMAFLCNLDRMKNIRETLKRRL